MTNMERRSPPGAESILFRLLALRLSKCSRQVLFVDGVVAIRIIQAVLFLLFPKNEEFPMKNRFTGVVIGQIVSLMIVCMVSAFIALVSFGGIAGVAIASKPERIFQYAAPLTCPNGTVEYEEYAASYNRPGESQFNVYCVVEDGTRTDISLASIGYSLLGFYLACFLPLCIPGGLAAIIVPIFFLRGRKREPDSPSAIETP